MTEITSVPMLVAAIALSVMIASLHILTAVTLKDRRRSAVGYVNIFLHAPLLVTLVLSGVGFEWGVLAMAASAFLYTLLRYIPYRLTLERVKERSSDAEPADIDRGNLSDSTVTEEEGSV